MRIHKEGYQSLLITILVLLVINILINYFFPLNNTVHLIAYVVSAILFLLVLQFFRSPKRIIEIDENIILCPADGKVVVIEETLETEYFGDKRLQVSVFMSPVNVHINWFPIGGEVKYAKYHPGKYLVAWHPKSSTDNERTTIVVEHPVNGPVLFRQIAGALARRIVYYCREDDVVAQGSPFGFIKFGSRVDLFLPLNTKINVSLNEKVKGGKTVIGTFH